jgi:predicted hydrocarbon binding protein
MEIRDRAVHDPVVDLIMPDAYMRWALLAAEEVTGKQGLKIALRDAGLERLADSYPPNELTVTCGLRTGDYANLFAALTNFFGRAGKSMQLRVGRLSAQHAIEQQGAVFNLAATMAIRLLPFPAQVKRGLENMQGGFHKIWADHGEEMRLWVIERPDAILYAAETCTSCAGKEADRPICVAFTGVLQESIHWLTGKEADVQEIKCRAMGEPACVWQISKKPRE